MFVKLTLPKIRPSGGVIISFTNESTILTNAVPTMTPIAISTTVPLVANSLKFFKKRMVLPSLFARLYQYMNKGWCSFDLHASSQSHLAIQQKKSPTWTLSLYYSASNTRTSFIVSPFLIAFTALIPEVTLPKTV